jgi:hypothetical protein
MTVMSSGHEHRADSLIAEADHLMTTLFRSAAM